MMFIDSFSARMLSGTLHYLLGPIELASSGSRFPNVSNSLLSGEQRIDDMLSHER